MAVKLVYIAGPMKGVPLFNFPAFDAAEEFLRLNSYDVVNPAQIDRQHGFYPEKLPADYDWSIIPESAGTLEQIMRRDLNALLECDAIFMLPGWENSKGATAERALAIWKGLEVIYHADAYQPAAVTTTKPSNPKDNVGSRKPGLSAIPCGPLYEAGAALAYGGLKYGRHNWRAIGVRSSVYYDASLRHIMAWWEGEDTDPDSGLPHLALAIAGLMVLRDAEIIGNVTDDRPIATGSPSTRLKSLVEEIIDRVPNPLPAYTQAAQQ